MTDELMSEIKAPKTDGSIIMVVGVGGGGGGGGGEPLYSAKARSASPVRR